MTPVYLWQAMISPHMTGLARELAILGHTVTFCAVSTMTMERQALGWQPGRLGDADLQVLPTSRAQLAAVEAAPKSAVHLVQGLRPHAGFEHIAGMLRNADRRTWAMAEEVDPRGVKGLLRRRYYRDILSPARSGIEAVFAIGENMRALLDYPGNVVPVHPFTYFLDEASGATPSPSKTFSIVFAGQMIERKRLDLLIEALSDLLDEKWRLDIVGTGPLEKTHRDAAIRRLGQDRVRWHGGLPMPESRARISRADLLVLPSDHDGWGAVVSEALIEGTRAICSDRCGAREAVRRDGGAVFPAGDAEALRAALQASLHRGSVCANERSNRKARNVGLTAPAGARYVSQLVEGSQPCAPWLDDNAMTSAA